MDEHPFFELAGKGLYLALFELDGAISEGKESVVSTTLDVLAGMEFGTALADNNIALHGDLITIDFHAKAFRNGITSETG